MRRIWLPVAIFVAGIAAIIVAVATGEAEVSLAVIFPVFTGSSPIFLLGIVLIILSFILGFALLLRDQEELIRDMPLQPGNVSAPERRRRTEYGGVVLIGPVPIAFGSDKKIAIFMLVLGVIVMVVLLSIFILSS